MQNTNTKWKAIILSAALGFSFSVPSAFADEVQIFSNEQREENANLLILDFDDTGGDVILQFGESLGEELYWDTINGQFVFTDDLNIEGDIDIDGTITTGSSNVQLTNAAGYIDGEQVQDNTIDDDSIDFGLGTDQVNAADLSADSTDISFSTEDNVQGILEDISDEITNGAAGTDSDIFTIDQDGNAADVALKFGDTIGETLTWDADANGIGDGAFVFSDDVNIAGDLAITGTVDGVDVSDLDNTVSDHLDGGENKHDASEIDVESATADNFSSGDLESALGNIDTNIGDRAFTNDNVLTDGQTVTASLDALDTEVGDLATDIANTGNNIGSQTYTEDNVVTDNETVTSSIDSLDQAIGDQTYTNNNIVTDGQDVSDSIDAIDTEIGNINTSLSNVGNTIGDQNYTEDNEVTDEESTTASIDALDQAIGDRSSFTGGNLVGTGDDLVEAITAIDTALGGINGDGTKTSFLTINDLTIQTDGSNNRANLYNDSETGTNPHQFYILKTRRSSLQDLDLKFKVKLPEDFTNFDAAGDLSFFYKNTGVNATDSAVDISVEDKDGDAAYASGGTGLFNASWTEYIDEFDGANFDPQPGEYIYITVKAYGSFDGGYQSPYVGEIVLKYNSSDL